MISNVRPWSLLNLSKTPIKWNNLWSTQAKPIQDIEAGSELDVLLWVKIRLFTIKLYCELKIFLWKSADTVITLTTELGHSDAYDAYEYNYVKFQIYEHFYEYIWNLALEN